MNTLDKHLNWLIRLLGNFSGFACLFLVFIMMWDVLMRYAFQISFPWVFELEWHLFGLIFLLGISTTYSADKHVRVDVFFSRFPPQFKVLVNRIGNLFFVVPFASIGFYYSLKYTLNSFEILEGSPDPGGLPFRFLLKGMIPFMFLVLALQGFLFGIRGAKQPES